MSGTGGILNTSQRRAPSGTVSFNGANNGLSIDPVSGKVVLGDNGNGFADLLSERNIQMGDFDIIFFTEADKSGFVQLASDNIGPYIHVEQGTQGIINATPPILLHTTNPGGIFEAQLGNDPNAVFTEARWKVTAGTAGDTLFGGVQGSLLYGTTSYVRAVNAALSLITEGNKDIVSFRNNIEVERLTATQRIAHVADKIIFDGMSLFQSANDNNIATGWDFATAGGTVRGFIRFNGNQGWIRFGGEAGGYHPELWSNGLKRLDIEPAGNTVLYNDAAVQSHVFQQDGTTQIFNGAVQLFSLDNFGALTINGSIQTGDPGLGAGQWLLGTVVNAVSVLNTTQYVQVDIGGALIKLATFT